MACKSMTGFGQAAQSTGSFDVKVELRSVNHRFAEFAIRVPRDLSYLEEHIRSYLARHIHRGRVDVYLSLETHRSGRHVDIQWDVLKVLLQADGQAREKLQFPLAPLSVSDYLLHPEVLQVKSVPLPEAEVVAITLQTLENAVSQLLAMRQREGERLISDMQFRVSELASLVELMTKQADGLPARYREKLNKRLTDLAASNMDEQRMEQEIVLFAERMTIDEELVRLGSHLNEFHHSVSQTGPIGRRLDFLVQEMHREMNTIGSKSANLNISKAVVDAKVLIEQLREQAQNIE